MRYTTRLGLAVGFLAAVAIAGSAVAQVGDGDAPADRDAPAFQAKKGFFGPRHHGFGMGRDLVTGSGTFQTEDGFVTKQVDIGDVTSAAGDTLTIERADGESVTVTVTDDAKIRRDREEATLDDLQAGDRAHIVQVDDGDGPAVVAVMALSPEALAEREERRAEWEERHGDRMDRMKERFERSRERFSDRADHGDAEPTSA